MPRLLRLLLTAMLYMRSSDGQVGKAQADGTQDEALVVGFADDCGVWCDCKGSCCWIA